MRIPGISKQSARFENPCDRPAAFRKSGRRQRIFRKSERRRRSAKPDDRPSPANKTVQMRTWAADGRQPLSSGQAEFRMTAAAVSGMFHHRARMATQSSHKRNMLDPRPRSIACAAGRVPISMSRRSSRRSRNLDRTLNLEPDHYSIMRQTCRASQAEEQAVDNVAMPMQMGDTWPQASPVGANLEMARRAWLEAIRALARSAAQQDHAAALRQRQVEANETGERE